MRTKLIASGFFLSSIVLLLGALLFAVADIFKGDTVGIIVAAGLACLSAAMIIALVLMIKDLAKNGGREPSVRTQSLLDILFALIIHLP